ncbi:MAG: hypothetical protein H0V76_10640 [Blastocatellia bacterium]|nr:hypothetical protein [Blastocatellia bacterium]
MDRKLLILCLILAAAFAGCTTETPVDDRTAPKAVRAAATKPEAPDNAFAAGGEAANAGIIGTKTARELCFLTDTGDDVVLKTQTFAIDFAPFEDSCFVTAHNPEFDDPPMESSIAIYQKDKKVFDFPGQFNGAEFGCWVDAVSFQDVTGDGLVDVIVIGKCSARAAAYNENVVYINNGKGFETNEEANLKASELKTIKEVADFVRKNKQLFAR